jgi:hypothetical protein
MMKYIFLLISICVYTSHLRPTEVWPIKEKAEQVYDMLFVNFAQFSHEDLMAFGLVCRGNDAYLRSTSASRKIPLLKIWASAKPEIIDYLKWHGYGTRAECKKIVTDPRSNITKKKLILARLEVLDKARVLEHCGEWSNFKLELLHKPIPFYNVSKKLCFFGYGWENATDLGLSVNVHCYEATKITRFEAAFSHVSGPSENNVCMLRFKKQNGEEEQQTLYRFLEFRYLLEAILASPSLKNYVSSVTKEKGNFYYIFQLDEVIIPDNYKTIIPCREYLTHTSFDDLPEELVCAINKRYEEQNTVRSK